MAICPTLDAMGVKGLYPTVAYNALSSAFFCVTVAASPLDKATLVASVKRVTSAWIGGSFDVALMVPRNKGIAISRQTAVPTMIVQNHDMPVETLITSRDHRINPAGVQLIKSKEAKSPYWRGGGMLLAIVVSTMSGDKRPSSAVKGRVG